jgi:hypothetical protein
VSCRSTPANSAATTFARLNSDLNDVQTVSAFHLLRAEAGRDSVPPTRTQWEDFLNRERELVQRNTTITESRRRSLLRRLDIAATQAMPDGATWSALRGIRARTQVQSRELGNRYQSLADRLGIDVDTVRARAATYAEQVDTRRDAPPPPGYTSVGLRNFRTARLPLDRKTVYALTRLEEEAQAGTAARQPRTQDNRRIIRQPLARSSAIIEAGYDPDGGRLEIVFDSNHNRVYSYRNVPAAVWEEMLTGSAGRVWHRDIRNNRNVRYPDIATAEADAYRRQCLDCGQFTGSGHVCPDRILTEPAPMPSTPSTGKPFHQPIRHRNLRARSIASAARRAVADRTSGVVTVLPEPADLVQETRTGPVSLPVNHSGSAREDHAGDGDYVLTGTIIVLREDDETLGIDATQIACTCLDYQRTSRCPHIDAYGRAALRRVNPDLASQRDLADAQAAVQDALRQDWMTSQRFAADARARWAPDADVRYSDDVAAFDAAAQAGQARLAAGDSPVPYLSSDATDGMLTRDSGRGFGIEVEFDFPDLDEEERAEALERVAADLHAAGLTSTAEQQPYHSTSESPEGYSDQHAGGWVFEEDATVAGEIISPIMYDEADTWRNIALVCDIVTRHGGQATQNTGGHVHVGTAPYGSDPTNHTELVRLVHQHEDVIYRLAQNPRDPYGEHRPLGYCAPNPEAPMAGYTSIGQARLDASGHEKGLNFASVRGTRTDNVEFRHWDATLDPGVIQAQVKVSAALTVAAQRIASEHGTTPRPTEPLGSHRNRRHDLLGASRRQLTPEESAADSATTRSLIDTLFTRTEDKEQVASLYGATRWQRRTPYRGYTYMAEEGDFDDLDLTYDPSSGDYVGH